MYEGGGKIGSRGYCFEREERDHLFCYTLINNGNL
jgi:hypothetical protein